MDDLAPTDEHMPERAEGPRSTQIRFMLSDGTIVEPEPDTAISARIDYLARNLFGEVRDPRSREERDRNTGAAAP